LSKYLQGKELYKPPAILMAFGTSLVFPQFAETGNGVRSHFLCLPYSFWPTDGPGRAFQAQ